MRKLVIFGNGLGRAISNEDYNLEAALSAAWSNDLVLSNTQRQLIKQCLPEDLLESSIEEHPKSEEQLDKLQRVLAACDEIAKNEQPEGERWLTDHGRQFPYAIRSFVHCAASHFHQLPHSLPQEFVLPLVNWIYESRSHVATLNYDELLYRSFVGTKVFNGYDCLIDGFSRQFDSINLERRAKKPSVVLFAPTWQPPVLYRCGQFFE